MSKFKVFASDPSSNNSLNFNSVIGIMESTDSLIWLGTDGRGVGIYNPNTGLFRNLNHDRNDNNSLPGNVIKSMLEDGSGQIWFGTYSEGLSVFNRKTGTFKNYQNNSLDPYSLGDRSVWSLYQDSHGDIYLGYLTGFGKYEPETDSFRNFNQEQEFGSVISMLEDSEGVFWIASSSGLYIFKEDSSDFVRFDHDPRDSKSLLNNEVHALWEDSNNIFWIGTVNGLCYFDRDNRYFIRPKANAKFSNTVIHSIQGDGSTLWLNTNKGITKFDTESGQVVNYDVEDGLQGLAFNYASGTQSKYNDNMFFGGINGFNQFDPSEIKANSVASPIRFTKFTIYDQEIRALDTINGRTIIELNIDFTSEIDLIGLAWSLYAYKIIALRSAQKELEKEVRIRTDELQRIVNQLKETQSRLVE